MVARQNLTIYQGSDFRRALEFRDELGVLMDLTGYEFRSQARLKYESANPSFAFQFTIRDQVANPGLVDMVLVAADTSALSISKETKYIYDLEMVTFSGDTKRVLEGEIRLMPEVTR